MNGLQVRTALLSSLLALVVAACGGSNAEPTPTATATVASPSPTATSPQPTATPDPEAEVLAAYLAYWDRYAEAMLTLDAEAVAGVASDEELERVRNDVESLRSQGVAARVVLEHHPVVVEVTATSAIVLDEMTNNSFYVDPETLEPPEAEGSGEALVDTFFLEKVDGRWIVVRSVRQN